MKLMIASDIHGSARYCGQMLEAYRREEADRLLILGDILYHGPRNDLPEGYAPKEVIAMLNPMREHLLCVRGNCDTEVDQHLLCVRGNCDTEVDQMVLKFPIMADYCFLELPANTLSGEIPAGKSAAAAGSMEKKEHDAAGQADGSAGTVSIFATHGHVYHPKHLDTYIIRSISPRLRTEISC